MLLIIPFYCFASLTKMVEICELSGGNVVKLVSKQTIDGDTPYFIFRNLMVSAFLDDENDYSGKIVLSKCINHTLIFVLNYGSPYLKGCLVTGINNTPQAKKNYEGLCFSERNSPEAVWFGKDNTLIVIENDNKVGEWSGNYIIYDSKRKDAYSSNELPKKEFYDIYPVK